MTLIYAGIFKASQKCLISLGTFENPSLSSFLSSQSHSQSVKSSLHQTQREFCPSVSSKARIQTTQANFYFVHFFSFFFFSFWGQGGISEVTDCVWFRNCVLFLLFCFVCIYLFVLFNTKLCSITCSLSMETMGGNLSKKGLKKKKTNWSMNTAVWIHLLKDILQTISHAVTDFRNPSTVQGPKFGECL